MGRYSRDTVIVSNTSHDSDDPYDIIESNISFVNAQLAEQIRTSELSRDALRSYYADYYLAQMNNGGFSQFVYNSRWDPDVIGYVREGVEAVGAVEHLALFERASRLVEDLGPKKLKRFLDSGYFGRNRIRDALSVFDDEFFALCEREDLIALNARWLRGLPNLCVLSLEEMHRELGRRVDALPDRAERVAQARADEPRSFQVIRALCRAAGQELHAVTEADPTHRYRGRRAMAWHFVTDAGPHYMVEVDDRAIMFGGDTGEPVCELALGDDFPDA